jgi:hypothetical protein
LLIRKGLWSAKGSVVFEGSSLGVPVEVDLDIVEDQDGITLTGEIQGAGKGDVSIRIGADDVGTYVVDARVGSFALDGIAKLESEPNVCLLWNQGKPNPLPLVCLWWIQVLAAEVFSGRRTRLLLGRFCSGPHSKWWVVTMWCP